MIIPYSIRGISEVGWCTCDEQRGWVDCGGFVDYCQPPGGDAVDYGQRYPRPDCGSCSCSSGWPHDACDLRNCE